MIDDLSSNTYYTLLIRDDKHSPWQIHFGDYDREVVCAEYDDMRENCMAGNMRIIVTGDEQSEIDAQVKVENAR